MNRHPIGWRFFIVVKYVIIIDMKLPLTISGQKITIEKLVPGGQGIGTLAQLEKPSTTDVSAIQRTESLIGKKGFFWNTLPGEIVTEFTIARNKSKYYEAIAERIENPSPHRTEPKDECFLSTSPWQMMDYNYELEQKRELLIEVFRQNHLDISAMLDSVTVQTDDKDFSYRNKMEYALYWNIKDSKIKLAFHQRGSHRKVPIAQSSIERPEIYEKACQIINELNERHEEARKYQSLLLRTNQKGKVSGGLYENHQPHPVFSNLSDTILGMEYSYSPNGFFQINLPVYEMVLKEIQKHITTEKVLDLYAGVGTIGLSTARDKNLVLVESNKAAYVELEKNCNKVAGTNNITPVLSNSEDALDYIAPDQTVIVDPPRAGCDKKLLEKLLEVKPGKIIYLSCNPATQARDIAILTGANVAMTTSQQAISAIYQIEKIQPFNFFPRTPHLENLIILSLQTTTK